MIEGQTPEPTVSGLQELLSTRRENVATDLFPKILGNISGRSWYETGRSRIDAKIFIGTILEGVDT